MQTKELFDKLKEGWHYIEYTKKDGQSKVMLATLKDEHLPTAIFPEYKEGMEYLNVMTPDGWRTLISENIKCMQKKVV